VLYYIQYQVRINIEKIKVAIMGSKESKGKQGIERKKRVVAYLRVSTEKQDFERQEKDLLKYANDNHLGAVEVISEKISSVSKDKKINDLIEELQKGDVILVWELSRIGRSMRGIYLITSKALDKGIDIYILNINQKIDNTVNSQIMVFAWSLSAQLEKQVISERTKSALNALKKRGVKLGRPEEKGRKLREHFEENPAEKEKYMMLWKAGLSVRKIAISLGMSQVQVGQYIKAHWKKNSVNIV